MNEYSSKVKVIDTAVKNLKSDHAVENTVKQVITAHPLTQGIKHIKFRQGMFDLGEKHKFP